jgi:hypothetical protein
VSSCVISVEEVIFLLTRSYRFTVLSSRSKHSDPTRRYHIDELYGWIAEAKAIREKMVALIDAKDRTSIYHEYLCSDNRGSGRRAQGEKTHQEIMIEELDQAISLWCLK